MESHDASFFEFVPEAFSSKKEKGVLQNILFFCRILKGLKINITTGRILDVFRSLKHIKLSSRDELYYALRANLISRHEEIFIFDRIFQLFWISIEASAGPENDSQCKEQLERFIEEECFIEEMTAEKGDKGDNKPEQKGIPEYSPVETLASKDFSAFSDEEIVKINEIITRIVNRIAIKNGRRRYANPKGRDLSFRRTIRMNLKYGGETLLFAWEKRKPKKVKILALVDVSGSMDCYSNFFVQFIHALQVRFKGVESFVFSTRLTRITEQLKNKSINDALKEISKIVLHWSGGTNIGSCLQRFNSEFSPQLLNEKSVVMIISDGWDRGDTDLLESQMGRLKRNCRNIIWLNPLLSNPNYQPLCKGIKAALPHVSHFLPFYNLNSLIKLKNTLNTIF